MPRKKKEIELKEITHCLSIVHLFFFSKQEKHKHMLQAPHGPRPLLRLHDSWLLNRDTGNLIKSFSFDTQPALD